MGPALFHPRLPRARSPASRHWTWQQTTKAAAGLQMILQMAPALAPHRKALLSPFTSVIHHFLYTVEKGTKPSSGCLFLQRGGMQHPHLLAGSDVGRPSTQAAAQFQGEMERIAEADRTKAARHLRIHQANKLMPRAGSPGTRSLVCATASQDKFCGGWMVLVACTGRACCCL